MDVTPTPSAHTLFKALFKPPIKLLFALICFWPLYGQATTPCLDFKTTEAARVKFITDGDTLTLTDGRRIRLIGLNAPELQPTPQPLARQALTRLRDLIAADDQQVLLTPGVEPVDRHGRHLAHVWSRDGQLLAGILIEEGLAVQTSVAPNTRCASNYAAHERSARKQKRGVWQDDGFWRVSFKALQARDRGFRFIQDRVIDVQESSTGTRLLLKHGVIIDIDRSISLLDPSGNKIKPTELRQQMVEVRGWLFRYRKQHHLKLHHTANFRLLTP